MKLLMIMGVLISACSQGQDLRWSTPFSLPAQENGAAHPGVAGPMTGVIGDRLVIAGGANFPEKMPWEGGRKEYSRQAYVYRISDGVFRLVHRQVLETAVSYAGSCTAGGALYVAGGENSRGPVSSVMRISWQGDSLVTETLPSLPLALTNGSLVCASGKLYFTGGENRDRVSDKIYEFDLSGTRQWREAYRLPYPVTNAVVVSDGRDKIYLAGGRKRNENGISTFYDQLLEVDRASGDVRSIATLPAPAAAGTGVWDPAGSILLFGGDTGETFHRVEELLAEIAQTRDPARKKELDDRKAEVQRSHPGFSPACHKYDLKKKKWFPLAPISGASPVTTTALTYGDLIIIPSGEIRAGVRTDQVLVAKQENKHEK